MKTETSKQEAPKAEAPTEDAQPDSRRRRRQPVRAMNDPRSVRKQAENDQPDQ